MQLLKESVALESISGKEYDVSHSHVSSLKTLIMLTATYCYHV